MKSRMPIGLVLLMLAGSLLAGSLLACRRGDEADDLAARTPAGSAAPATRAEDSGPQAVAPTDRPPTGQDDGGAGRSGESDPLTYLQTAMARRLELQHYERRQEVTVVSTSGGITTTQIVRSFCRHESLLIGHCQLDLAGDLGDGPFTEAVEQLQREDRFWTRERATDPWLVDRASLTQVTPLAPDQLTGYLAGTQIVGATLLEEIPVIQVASRLQVDRFLIELLGDDPGRYDQIAAQALFWVDEAEGFIRRGELRLELLERDGQTEMLLVVVTEPAGQPVAVPDPDPAP